MAGGTPGGSFGAGQFVGEIVSIKAMEKLEEFKTKLASTFARPIAGLQKAKNSITDLGKKVGTAFDKVAKAASKAGSKLKTAAQKIGNATKNAASFMVGFAVGLASPLTNKLAPAFNKLKGVLSTSIGKIKSVFGKIGPLFKRLGDSKLGKAAKALGNAFKSMGKASVQAFAMEQLMKLMEPFLKLLELVAPIFDVLNALLTVMVNEVFKDLIPYTIAFSMALLTLMPYFKMIGSYISDVLFDVFKTLYLWLGHIYEAMQPLSPVFEVFVAIAKTLFELFLVNPFKSLMDTWELFKEVFKVNPFTSVEAFFTAIGALTKGIFNGIIGSINRGIGSINDLIPGTKYDLGTIPMLASGGITTGLTPAILGDNPSKHEMIVPLEKADEMGFGGNNSEEILFVLERMERNSRPQNQARLRRRF